MSDHPPVECNDPECDCQEPAFTEPMEALRFLSGRMKYAGIDGAVAKFYARDIDRILAAQQERICIDPIEHEAVIAELDALKGRLAGLSAKWWERAGYFREQDVHEQASVIEDCAADLERVIGATEAPTAPGPERP